MLFGAVLLNFPKMISVINVPFITEGTPTDMKSSDFDPMKLPSAKELLRKATIEELIGGGGANSILDDEF
jgi:hypothetical protein